MADESLVSGIEKLQVEGTQQIEKVNASEQEKSIVPEKLQCDSSESGGDSGSVRFYLLVWHETRKLCVRRPWSKLILENSVCLLQTLCFLEFVIVNKLNNLETWWICSCCLPHVGLELSNPSHCLPSCIHKSFTKAMSLCLYSFEQWQVKLKAPKEKEQRGENEITTCKDKRELKWKIKGRNSWSFPYRHYWILTQRKRATEVFQLRGDGFDSKSIFSGDSGSEYMTEYSTKSNSGRDL